MYFLAHFAVFHIQWIWKHNVIQTQLRLQGILEKADAADLGTKKNTNSGDEPPDGVVADIVDSNEFPETKRQLIKEEIVRGNSDNYPDSESESVENLIENCEMSKPVHKQVYNKENLLASHLQSSQVCTSTLDSNHVHRPQVLIKSLASSAASAMLNFSLSV